MKKVVTEGENYRERYNLAFDTERTEVYERLGDSDVFRVRLTEGEALALRDQINEALEE